MMLVGPGGQRAMVMSDAGEDPLVSADLVLDDEAAAPLPQVHGTVSGSYRPTNYKAAADTLPAPAPSTTGVGSALSVFDGTDPNGTWQLFVADNDAFDSGTIAGGWSLRISTADQPTPVPARRHAGARAPTTPLRGSPPSVPLRRRPGYAGEPTCRAPSPSGFAAGR